MTNGMKKWIVAFAALAASAVAQADSVDRILVRDVICENQSKKVEISRDLSKAVVTFASGRVSTYPVDYLHQTGGRGQILVLKIVGLDGLHVETVIRDVDLLMYRKVVGYRARQIGYGVEVLEKFSCDYRW